MPRKVSKFTIANYEYFGINKISLTLCIFCVNLNWLLYVHMWFALVYQYQNMGCIKTQKYSAKSKVDKSNFWKVHPTTKYAISKNWSSVGVIVFPCETLEWRPTFIVIIEEEHVFWRYVIYVDYPYLITHFHLMIHGR